MDFKDEEIDSLDLTKVDDFVELIVKYLCGEACSQTISDEDKNLVTNLIQKAREDGLNYEQFNELLLLLNQSRIGKGFFNFFFGKDIVKLDDIKNGVTKFRGLAMLRFANFRFAYKKLIDKSEEEIASYWKRYDEEDFKKRSLPSLQIEEIEKDKVWYAGELTPTKIRKDEIEFAKKKFGGTNSDQIEQFGKKIMQMNSDAQQTQEKALKNTDIYLTWEYMDVYIATSMRQRWEFEETFDFIKNVFSDERLKDLNLRYFNPTMSKCTNPRDKGLIEGLMLKRARCTIYMAQEGDTMGKDSELAASLARSTPVIAFVPKCDDDKAVQEYAEKISKYPLEFFKTRLLILDGEGVFDDPEYEERLKESYNEFRSKSIEEVRSLKYTFLEKIDEYRKLWPFSLWREKDDEFKENNREIFSNICQILSVAECYNFDRRAAILRGRHPLSMQVDLQTGVANGVLVVRDAKSCADLLYRLLTNSMEFEIKHPKIFGLSGEEAKTLINKFSTTLKEKFRYDQEMGTLNLLRTLTDQEIKEIKEIPIKAIEEIEKKIDEIEKKEIKEREELKKQKGFFLRLKMTLENFESEGATVLKEKISGSIYRVITDNKKLTNSFWNLFA